VLGSLGCVAGELALVTVISLPRATYVRLQPHANRFAEALGVTADPRQVLTQLVNRFVVVSVGDTIQLQLGEERTRSTCWRCAGCPVSGAGCPRWSGLALWTGRGPAEPRPEAVAVPQLHASQRWWGPRVRGVRRGQLGRPGTLT
jgi:hypothetical protein